MRDLGQPRRHLESVASTMDVASAWAEDGAPHGAVVTTDHQTGGRGRLGRTWTDVPSESLLASIVLRPDLPADRLGLLPLAVGLSIASAIDAVTGTQGTARVKWPNDVLIEDRKVAGILTEATHSLAGPTVIVGMGINVSQTSFPGELASQAGSIRQLVGLQVDRDDLLHAILHALADQLDGLESRPVSTFLERFERRMARRGKRVTVSNGSAGTLSGVALGVASDGALRLRVEGAEQRVYAGDMAPSEPAHFLALDVGNSTVKAGLWDGSTWTLARWPTTPETTASTWADRLLGFAPNPRSGGLVSVVPAVEAQLTEALRQLDVPDWRGHVRPETVAPASCIAPSPDLELATAGSDRFAAAAGATRFLDLGQSAVVVCAGTAVTVERIRATTSGWTWLGGVIAPGPTLLRRSLPDHTAALPLVDWPEGAARSAGRTTPEAMQNGLAGLFAGGVSELVRRAAADLPGSPLVVATGGWAPWLAEHTDAVSHVEPMLILDGVRVLSGHA
ncbi:MAG: biotin--[acetyl-CoA-carboxylase] ligase [Bacteroidota bacterium]